jgi:hypothetical protein
LGDSSIESPNFTFPGSSEGTKTEIPTEFGINVFFHCENSDKCANYPTARPQGDPGDVPEDSRLCDNDPCMSTKLEHAHLQRMTLKRMDYNALEPK